MHLRPSMMAAAFVLSVGMVTGCSTSSEPAEDAAPVSEADETMSVTFVRHAESAGNASGLIDTSTPGPGLSDVGERQAAEVAEALSDDRFDCVYASTMVRTQQTAEGLASALDEPVEVLPGLREIEAGEFEGQPEESVAEEYLAAPADWIQGNLDTRIPGSIDGHEFDQRFDEALSNMRDAGCVKPVVFSHGGAIMVWTLMNTENADPDLLRDTVENTSQVVIEGVPDEWTLISWNDREIR